MRFQSLTKYIKLFENDSFGKWQGGEEKDGVITMPYVSYTAVVIEFIHEIHDFAKNNNQYEMHGYRDVLERKGIKVQDCDVDNVDAQTILCMMMSVVRADRFAEGTLIHYLQEGYFDKWLKRLKEIDMLTMDKVRILHAADFHLGTNLSSLGELAAQRNEEMIKTFGRVIDLAKEKEVDAVIISGDLFDNCNPSEDITAYVSRKLGELSETPVFIALGNHDFGITFDVPSNVHIFSEETESIPLGDNCVIYGQSFVRRFVNQCSVKGFLPEDNEKINIFVLHGDLVGGGQSEYNPVTPSAMGETGVDYFALGHIHKYSGMQKIGGTHYAYPGIPEPRGFDELGSKGVIIAEVSKHSVESEFVPVAKRNYVEAECDISSCENIDTVIELISNTVNNRDNLYKIILTGETELKISPELIIRLLPTDLYYVKIYDRTKEKIDIEALMNEKSLKGIFVKNTFGNERAMRYGLAALNGEKVKSE